MRRRMEARAQPLHVSFKKKIINKQLYTKNGDCKCFKITEQQLNISRFVVVIWFDGKREKLGEKNLCMNGNASQIYWLKWQINISRDGYLFENYWMEIALST